MSAILNYTTIFNAPVCAMQPSRVQTPCWSCWVSYTLRCLTISKTQKQPSLTIQKPRPRAGRNKAADNLRNLWTSHRAPIWANAFLRFSLYMYLFLIKTDIYHFHLLDYLTVILSVIKSTCNFLTDNILVFMIIIL